VHEELALALDDELGDRVNRSPAPVEPMQE
jgi:hypothetical protein